MISGRRQCWLDSSCTCMHHWQPTDHMHESELCPERIVDRSSAINCWLVYDSHTCILVWLLAITLRNSLWLWIRFACMNYYIESIRENWIRFHWGVLYPNLDLSLYLFLDEPAEPYSMHVDSTDTLSKLWILGTLWLSYSPSLQLSKLEKGRDSGSQGLS